MSKPLPSPWAPAETFIQILPFPREYKLLLMKFIVKQQEFKRQWLYTTLTHRQVPRAGIHVFRKVRTTLVSMHSAVRHADSQNPKNGKGANRSNIAKIIKYKIIFCQWIYNVQILPKILILCYRASQYKSNETPTWCYTVQVLFLQSHSTCFGRQAHIIRSI